MGSYECACKAGFTGDRVTCTGNLATDLVHEAESENITNSFSAFTYMLPKIMLEDVREIE